jgi:hypothetical protein
MLNILYNIKNRGSDTMKQIKKMLGMSLFILGTAVYAVNPSFKDKNTAISGLGDAKRRVFETGNMFTSKTNTRDWINAFAGAANFVEDNATVFGKPDKDIMAGLKDLRSANTAILSTISNAREAYFGDSIIPNMQEGKTFVMDNMIRARNIIINVERALNNVTMVLPGKKDALAVVRSLALKMKDIANKAIDDVRVLEKQQAARGQ